MPNRRKGVAPETVKRQEYAANKNYLSGNAFDFDYAQPQDWLDQVTEQRGGMNQYAQTGPIVGREYDDRGMPVDWDYKNATRGPSGEQLPPGALGWNPHGKPDWGTGIDAWWRRTTWKFTHGMESLAADTPTIKEATANMSAIIDRCRADILEAEAKDQGKHLAQNFGKVFGAAIGTIAQAIGGTQRDLEGGGDVTVWNAIPRVIGAAFDTIGLAVQELARGVKEDIIVPRGLVFERAIQDNNMLPDNLLDQWKKWLGPAAIFPAAATAGWGVLSGEVNLDELKIGERELLAAKLGYTAWKDGAVKEEFLRRAQSGEDPRLLAMEMANPLQEMVGEILYDPLNVIGFALPRILTVAKDARYLARAESLGKEASALIKAVEVADDVGKPAAMEKLWGWIDNLVVENTGDLERMAGDLGLLKETVGSRRAGVTEMMSDIVSDVLSRTGGQPDDTISILKAMTMMLDADPETKVKGLELMNYATGGYSIPMSTLFGPDGVKTALVFKKIFEADDGKRILKLLSESGGDIRKLNTALAEDLRNVVDNIFPDIQTRIKTAAEYAELAKAGKSEEELAAFVKANPLADTPPPAIYETLLKVYEPWRKIIHKPFGQAQGVIFMGLNPAYRMRNRMGNFAVMFVDQGPIAALEGLLDNRFMPWGKQWARTTLNTWSGGAGLAGEFREIGGAAASFNTEDWVKGVANYFARSAGADEAVSGTHIMAREMRRVVSGVLTPKKALSGIQDVVKSEDDIKAITRLAEQYHGNVTKAVQQFALEQGVDPLQTLLFLDDRQLFMANGLEIDDAIRSALDPALTTTEKIDELDKITENHRVLASAAAGEARASILNDTELAESVTLAEEGIGSERGARLGSVFEQRYAAEHEAVLAGQKEFNQTANMTGEAITNKFIDEEIARAGSKADADVRSAANYARKTTDEIRNAVTEKATDIEENVSVTMRDFREDTVRIRNEILGQRGSQKAPSENLYEVWQQRAKRGWMSAAPETFDGFSRQDFLAELWQGYFRRVIRKWHDARIEILQEYKGATDNLLSVLSPEGVGFDVLDDIRKGDLHIPDTVSSLRGATDRKASIADLLYRAEVDADGFMHLNVLPDEAQSWIVEEWSRIVNIDAIKDPVGMQRGVETVNGWIENLRQAALDGQDVSKTWRTADPEIVKAVENVAGSRTNAQNLIETLVSKPPEGELTLTRLRAQREVFANTAPTRTGISNKISQIDEELEKLGNPARTVDDLQEGHFVSVRGQEFDGRIIERYKKGNAVRYKVRMDDGTVLDRAASNIEVSGVETTNALRYDELSEQRLSLEKMLHDATNKVPEDIQNQLDMIDERIAKIEQQIAERQAAVAAGEEVTTEVKIAESDRVYKPFKRPIVGPMDDATPTPARVASHTQPHVKKLIDEIKDYVSKNDGARLATAKYSPEEVNRLREWALGAQTKVNEARFVGGKIATEARDFALHNYPKRYGMDLVAGMIFPYQFWYSRSYIKWMKRLAMNPEVLSNYIHYRTALENIHTGLPDWWKQQLNTNELLGLDSQNPLYFNLEAMVNPLYGLTGTDFSDPKRRVDWWGGAMEDIQKMGPSVWSPYVFALAAYYSATGEKEAAARWGGRLFPQSKPLRDVTALLDPKGLGVELDPYVYLFGNGVEAYERGRVGRQAGIMISEGKWNPEDIIDAVYKQEGEIWDIARARAIRDRAPNIALATTPFLFGVGLKPRTQGDIQIDRMYQERDLLMARRTDMSDADYSKAWDKLREVYPFMDVVLMSKRAGLSRDESLAWNVISRVPPGMTTKIAEQVGLNPQLLRDFQASHGDLSGMSEADRMQFMGGVLQMDGLLKLPDNITQEEWRTAKRLYGAMLSYGENQFGPDIWAMTDVYFAIQDPQNPEVGRAFLEANPIVQQALDFRQITVQNTPLLATYYTSTEKIEAFYKQNMYAEAEQLFGKNLWDNFEVYSRLKDMGEDKAARQFWKDHPELKGYMQFRDEHLPIITDKVNEMDRFIPEPKGPFYRQEGFQPDIQLQPYNTDEHGRYVDQQVMSYATGTSQFKDQRADINRVVRAQADTLFPNTRRLADRYYGLADSNPTKATQLLQGNAELEARVRWEFERLLRLALSREGEFVAAGAQRSAEIQQYGGNQDQSFESIMMQGPLQRLLNDPEGLPPYLQELLTPAGQ